MKQLLLSHFTTWLLQNFVKPFWSGTYCYFPLCPKLQTKWKTKYYASP